MLAAAEALGVPLPLASLVHDRFLAVRSQGFGSEHDLSALAHGALSRRGTGQALNVAATASVLAMRSGRVSKRFRPVRRTCTGSALGADVSRFADLVSSLRRSRRICVLTDGCRRRRCAGATCE